MALRHLSLDLNPQPGGGGLSNSPDQVVQPPTPSDGGAGTGAPANPAPGNPLLNKLINQMEGGGQAPAADPAPPNSGDPNQPPQGGEQPPTPPDPNIPPPPAGMQNFTFRSMGKNVTTHISNQYNLKDSVIAAELQDLHSAKHAYLITKVDGTGTEQVAAVKAAARNAREEEAARWKTIIENQPHAPAGSDGGTQKQMRDYVSNPAAYDKAVEEQDANTIALMEENAALRYGVTDLTKKVEGLEASFEKRSVASEQRGAAQNQLRRLKVMVPGLPGDPDADMEGFVMANTDPNGYMGLLGQKGFSLEQITQPDFPHQYYIDLFNQSQNPQANGAPAPTGYYYNNPLAQTNNGNLAGVPPANGQPASHSQSAQRNQAGQVSNATTVRDNLGGPPASNTPIGGNDDGQTFKEYGYARLYDRTRAYQMRATDPQIEDKFMAWYRDVEEQSVTSPLTGGGLQGRFT